MTESQPGYPAVALPPGTKCICRKSQLFSDKSESVLILFWPIRGQPRSGDNHVTNYISGLMFWVTWYFLIKVKSCYPYFSVYIALHELRLVALIHWWYHFLISFFKIIQRILRFDNGAKKFISVTKYRYTHIQIHDIFCLRFHFNSIRVVNRFIAIELGQ